MHIGISNNINNLHLLSQAVTRSISAENFNGEKGKGECASLKMALAAMPLEI